jgi:hypothetical protein
MAMRVEFHQKELNAGDRIGTKPIGDTIYVEDYRTARI